MLKEVVLKSFAAAIEGTVPIVGAIRELLLEPFIEATRTALSEMAGTEVVVRSVYRQSMYQALGELAAVVRLRSTTEGSLVLAFPQRTAAALAGRILAGIAQELDESLIRDCVGEIANVVAGQAKTMLAGGPYRFTFSVPQVAVTGNDLPPQQDVDCLVVAFGSDQGELALQLLWKR
jgi:chemotaxis protein CheX